jgi:hypothetical protein
VQQWVVTRRDEPVQLDVHVAQRCEGADVLSVESFERATSDHGVAVCHGRVYRSDAGA